MTPFEQLLLAICGRRGISLDFDGVNDFVSMGVIASMQFERTDPFSVAAWFRTTSSGFEPIIGNLTASPQFRGWELAVFQGEIRLEVINTNISNYLIVEATQPVNDGLWHHIVATYDGSSTPAGIELYLDGALAAKATVANTLAATSFSTAEVRVGARQGLQEVYAGRIHEAAVYDKELSGAEAATIYNGGKVADLTAVGPVANLLGAWRRTRTDGVSYPTFPDVSGAGNHGTMTNMTPDDITQDSPP